MQKSFLKSLALAALTILATTFSLTGYAQGLVSSGMTGSVQDNAGNAVAGATISAVHTPTNTKFTAMTGANGRFSFKGMPVGGPYTVTATFEGHNPAVLNEVQTSLGEDVEVVLVSKAEVVQLEKFVVSGSTTDLDANATGAGTVLSNQRIQAQPSVNRSFTDLMKTNPFVSIRAYPQVEALGINNRYNTITLDGAKINDSFGLNSSGLFSAFNPFSLDAVEQFSIQLTPYDVRQSGSAGAFINVVSKSGTNEFHGSVYDLYTNQNWQGPDEFGSNIHKRNPFKERTYGFTFGGPILRDRLFFFINFEKFIQDSAPTTPGLLFTTPDQLAVLSAIDAKIASFPGAPNLGTLGGAATLRKYDTKRLIKLDWNINQNHRMTVRYSDTVSGQPNYGSYNYTSFSTPSAIPGQPSVSNGGTGYSSAFYNLAIKEKVWATQLFSTWTRDFHTEFNYSHTEQDSIRAVPVAFPEIRIFNIPATNQSGVSVATNDAIRFGTEVSSMGNVLQVKTQAATLNGDYTMNNLTFTGGVDVEASDYYNLFRQGSYGIFDYTSLANFQADIPLAFERSVVGAGTPVADISKFKRAGVYGQVKWDPTTRLSITAGVRLDEMGSPIAPPENAAFKTAFGMTNAGTIDGTSSLQPRLGFNYALDDKRMTQIRGGTGVFLGRNPWVWISNSYGNSGINRYTALLTGTAAPTLSQYLKGTFSNTDPAYKFDAANPIGTIASGSITAAVNLIEPGMKLPAVWRSNLALDRKLPGLGAVFTVEVIQTKQTEALFVDNMNLRPTTVGADGRQRFAGAPNGAVNGTGLNPGFLGVIRTRTITAGESTYASVGINREMKNHWAYSVAYTRGKATDAQPLGSSTASSQWAFNTVFNQNSVEIARSDYEIRDRIQATLSHEFVYAKGFKSTVSLYYEGRSGQPYSWVYQADVNGDGNSTNDLVAVPTGPLDSRFDFSGMTSAQQDAYFKFMQSSGLTKYAGGWAPRNSFIGPWQNRLDLRFVQEIPTYKKVKVEFFADFMNFGSWFSKKLFNYVEEINNSTSNSNQIRVLGSATYTTTGLLKPTDTLNADGTMNIPTTSLITVNNADTRWKIQGGIRLKF